MFSLKYQNEYIKIPGDTSISIDQENPLFSHSSIPGSKVYNFDLPAENRRVFNFANELAVYSEGNFLEDVRLQLAGLPYKLGRLKIKKVSKNGFNVTYHSDAGLLAEKIKNLSLRDIDLGSEPYHEDPEKTHNNTAYALPTMQVPDLFDDDDDRSNDYSGYLNYFNGDYLANPLNGHYIAPCMYLTQLIEKLFNYYEFEIEGDWLQDETIRQVVILNFSPFSGNTVNYNEILPDIGIGKFLVAIQNLFGVTFLFHPTIRKVRIVRKSGIANQITHSGDWTQKFTKAWEKENNIFSGFELKAGEETATINDGSESISSDAGAAPIKLVRDQIFQSRRFSVPVIEDADSSSIYLAFYNGLNNDTQNGQYPQATDSLNNYSLKLSGDNGLYNNEWKKWLELLQSGFLINTEAIFNVKDMLTLRMDERIYYKGLTFFPYSVRHSISKGDGLKLSKVELFKG